MKKLILCLAALSLGACAMTQEETQYWVDRAHNSSQRLQNQVLSQQAQTQAQPYQAPAVGTYGDQTTVVRCLVNGIYTYCKAQ